MMVVGLRLRGDLASAAATSTVAGLMGDLVEPREAGRYTSTTTGSTIGRRFSRS